MFPLKLLLIQGSLLRSAQSRIFFSAVSLSFFSAEHSSSPCLEGLTRMSWSLPLSLPLSLLPFFYPSNPPLRAVRRKEATHPEILFEGAPKGTLLFSSLLFSFLPSSSQTRLSNSSLFLKFAFRFVSTLVLAPSALVSQYRYLSVPQQ